VAAQSNTDGGIIMVGVKDEGAIGEDRIVGVPKTELTALVTTLRSQIPEAISVKPAAAVGAARTRTNYEFPQCDSGLKRGCENLGLQMGLRIASPLDSSYLTA
jgi:hypothetical protein